MNNETILSIMIRLAKKKKYKSMTDLFQAAAKEWHDTYPYAWLEDISENSTEYQNDIDFLDESVDQTHGVLTKMAEDIDSRPVDYNLEIYIDEMTEREQLLFGANGGKIQAVGADYISAANQWLDGRDVVYSKDYNEAETLEQTLGHRWTDAEITLSQNAVNREYRKASLEKLESEQPEYVRVYSITGTIDFTVECEDFFGTFPIGEAVLPPFHPNCRCVWETVSREDYLKTFEE